MSESIISNEYECLACRTQINLHKHHIYGGTGRRNKSEEYGCWVYLCGRHHNLSNFGVHFDKEFDLALKQKCQRILEDEHGWTKERFIKTFGRNYL